MNAKLIGATALILVAGAVAWVSTATSRAPARGPHFRAYAVHGSMLSMGTAGGPTDMAYVTSGRLVDGTGRLAGRFGFACGMPDPDGNTCTATLALPSGHLRLTQGFDTPERFTWTIVGGSGVYRSAHGSVAFSHVKVSTAEMTIELAA